MLGSHEPNTPEDDGGPNLAMTTYRYHARQAKLTGLGG